jgi:hypothetical protein
VIVVLLLALSAPAMPNLDITPGRVNFSLSVQEICATKWGADRRVVTESMRREVFRAYHVPYAEHGKYEVDHLISRELGGADDVKNLWPQPWAGPYGAHEKDRLENALHRLVCANKLGIVEARRAVVTDWVAAYKKYVEGAR